MRIAVSSDEYTDLVRFVQEEVGKRGHEVEYFGPTAEDDGGESDWPDVTRRAVEKVAGGEADEAIVMCWTGTGASLVANKVPGIRAALCHDAETARGARIWNHANTLALSLRATSLPMAGEVLEAWFATPYSEDEWNRKQIERVHGIESYYSRQNSTELP